MSFCDVGVAHVPRSDILKKQAAQQAKEYDRLATELNQKTGNISDKRRD